MCVFFLSYYVYFFSSFLFAVLIKTASKCCRQNIRDLLDPTRVNLRVREHPTTGVFVENLSSCAVECYKDVQDLLEMGLEQRTTAATNMNSESSRSHSVFTISVRSSPMGMELGDSGGAAASSR